MKNMNNLKRYVKISNKLLKNQLDLVFLNNFVKNEVIPNFAKFKTANKNLKDTKPVKDSQQLLIEAEINYKKDKATEHIKELKQL